jgi:hypothetical protein
MLIGDLSAMARWWPNVNINTHIRCSRIWNDGPCGWSGTYQDMLVGYAHWFGYYEKPQPRLLACPRCTKSRNVDSWMSTILVNLIQSHMDQYCEYIPPTALETEQFKHLPIYGKNITGIAAPP